MYQFSTRSGDSQALKFSFRSLCLAFIAALLSISFAANAQIAGGTYTIPGSYATVAAAVTALNANGISGAVTFNCTGGDGETAPSGGILLGSATLNATTGAVNTITFKTASGTDYKITAETGAGSADFIFGIQGTDYVTINGIDLAEAAGNTTATTEMEAGYGFFLLNATSPYDACQNDVIENCTITLKNTNTNAGNAIPENGSSGILSQPTVHGSNTAVNPSLSGDLFSNNSFYSNTIQNITFGINILEGIGATADNNNTIGASGQGNTIQNLATPAGSAFPFYGIYTIGQNNLTVSYNTINNTAGGGSTTSFLGIGISVGGVTSAQTAVYTVNNNTITLSLTNTQVLATPFYTAGAICNEGIYAATYGNLTANNNMISMTETPKHSVPINGIMTYAGSAYNLNSLTASGNIINILQSDSSPAIAINASSLTSGSGNLSITGNTITEKCNPQNLVYTTTDVGGAADTTYASVSTSTLYGVYMAYGAGTNAATGNTITLTDSSIAPVYGIYSSTTGALNISSNNVKIDATIQTYTGGRTETISHGDTTRTVTETAFTAAIDFIYSNGTGGSENISNNTFASDSVNSTTGSLYCIYDDNSTPNRTIASNSTAGGLRKHRAGAGSSVASMIGILCESFATSGNITITQNTISNMTGDSTWNFYGLYTELGATSGTAQMLVAHNTIANCFSPTGSGGTDGILIIGNVTCDSNTISNISEGTGTGETVGIAISSGGSGFGIMTVSNNNINNIINADQPVGIYGGVAGENYITNIYGNKIYNIICTISAAVSFQPAFGIYIGPTGSNTAVDTINIYNNCIDSIVAGQGLSAHAADVGGIYLLGGTAQKPYVENVYDNTIHLEGSGPSGYVSACIIYGSGTATTNDLLIMRNNILSNQMTPNGSSIATDLMRTAASTSTSYAYSDSSNNNMFYAPAVPSANNVVYYDETNSLQTLSAYQTFMLAASGYGGQGQDANSVTEVNTPWLSTSGSSPNFLQIVSTATVCYNAGDHIPLDANMPQESIDYFGLTREGYTGYEGAATHPTIGASEILGQYIWSGPTSTAWATASNWTPAIVPSGCADSIYIPAGTPFSPTLSSATSVGAVRMDAGATLTLNANLSACGSWKGGSASNAIVTGTGITILDGSASQSISGETRFSELNLDNSAGAVMQTSSAVTIDTALDLEAGNFDASSGTLTFTSSSPTQIAIIDNFTGGNSGSLTGSIIAQRYYNTSSTYEQHMLGSPVSAPPLSQFGASGTAGYVVPQADCDESQMYFTSPYGTLFSYHESNPAAVACGMAQWDVVTTGNATNGVGYSYRKAGSGILSLSGTANLNTSYTVSGLTNSSWANMSLQGRHMSSGWALLSNPYLATLNLTTSNAGFDDDIQVWNDSGAFAGTYQPGTVGSSATVAPFQGFMVHKTATGGSLPYVIKATDRTRNTATFFSQNDNQLNIVAQNTSSGLLDQTTVAFNSNANPVNGFDPVLDADKLAGSLNRHTIYTTNGQNTDRWLSVNVLNSIATTGTVPLGFEPGVSGNYQLNFNGLNTFDPTTYIMLEDKQLNVMYDVRSGPYSFTSNASDNWDRFVLHFTPAAIISSVNATCVNPGAISIIQPGTANWNYTLTDAGQAMISSGILNQSNPISVNVQAGNYTLTLTDNNNYSVTKAIQVNGAPDVVAGFNVSSNNAVAQTDIQFTNTSQNAGSAVWNFGDGTTSTNASTTHAYAAAGTYTVTLTAGSTSGCSATASQSIKITGTATGISNITNGIITMWSNENRVYVDFTQLSNVNAVIKIYDILGRQISSDEFTSNVVYQKEINNIDAEYILVSVLNNGNLETKKLFITNTK